MRELAYRRPEWTVLAAAAVGWVALAVLLWFPTWVAPDGASGPGGASGSGSGHHERAGADLPGATRGGGTDPGEDGSAPRGTADPAEGAGTPDPAEVSGTSGPAVGGAPAGPTSDTAPGAGLGTVPGAGLDAGPVPGAHGLGDTLASVGAGVGFWLVMLVAMMLPALVPAVRYVAFAGARPRRQRTVAMFVGGYLAAWTPLGLAVALVHALAPPLGPLGVASLLLAVALWEVGPVKRRALRACHRTAPIRYGGRAADRSAARFGLRHGGVCLRLCGPLMVVVALAGHPLWLTVAASLVVWAQKLVRGAEAATPAVAVGAVLAAVGVGALGAAS